MATESMSMHPGIAQLRAKYDEAVEIAVVPGPDALSLGMNRSH